MVFWTTVLMHPPNHPSQPEEVNSQTYKKCQKVFQIWSQASMGFSPCVASLKKCFKKKHLSSHRCCADTKSIHPNQDLTTFTSNTAAKERFPAVHWSENIMTYMFLFYFVGNKRFIMLQEVSKFYFNKKTTVPPPVGGVDSSTNNVS